VTKEGRDGSRNWLRIAAPRASGPLTASTEKSARAEAETSGLFSGTGCCVQCGIEISREPLWRMCFMPVRFKICAALCLVGVAPLALAEDYAGGAIKSAETSAGEILTDANGMTLYTFDKDTAGTSNCYDELRCQLATADRGRRRHRRRGIYAGRAEGRDHAVGL
jgi:Secreted repeat of unknown function